MERNEAEKILNNAMHPDESVRVESEGKMKMLLNENYPCFLEILGMIMADRSVGYSLRVMASIILKNGLHSKNRRVQNGFANKWCNELCEMNRMKFIELLKQNLGSNEKFILENITKILGSIMRIEIETGMNNSHFLWILGELKEGRDIMANLKLLSVICNQLYDETNYNFEKNDDVVTIYRSAIYYLNAEIGDHELHKEVLLCVWNTMDIFLDLFNEQSNRFDFMERLGKYTIMGSDIVESALETFNKFIRLRYNLIIEELPRIAYFYNNILEGDDKGDNEGLVIQAMDFWEIIANEDKYNWLFNEYSEKLLGQMLRRLRKEELDDVDPTEHKSACRVLGYLRESVGCILMESTVARDFISDRLPSENPEKRAIGAIALACIYSPGDKCNNLIEFSLETLIEGLLYYENNENTVDGIKRHKSFNSEEFETYIHEFLFCIGKICERNINAVNSRISEIIERSGKIIFSAPSQIAASAAWTYSSLFHNLSSVPTPLYKDIMLLLINKLEIISISDYDLRNALVSALSGLIIRYVDQLLPVFNDLCVYLLQKITQLVSVTVTSENIFILEDLLSNYIPIFILVLKNPVHCESAQIISIFSSILRIPENKSHGEVFIGISTISTRIIDNLPQLIPAILQGIKSHDPFIMKVALNAMADCAISLQSNFDPYISSVIGGLVDSIASDTTALENKPFIIDNLADIALAVGQKFEPYLDMSIVLLDQVIHLDRSDNEDFVDNLRKSVVKLFNYILLSIGNTRPLREKLPSILQLLEQAYNLDLDHIYLIDCVDFLVDVRNIFTYRALPTKWVRDILFLVSSEKDIYSDSVLNKISSLEQELNNS